MQKIRFRVLDSIPEVLAWAQSEPMVKDYARRLTDLGLRHEARVRRPGPKGPTDLDLARIARDYVKLVQRGVRNPVETMRKYRKYSYSADRMRDLIHLARERGLLTGAPPGRPGGSLTPYAEQLLAKHREASS